MAVAADDRLYQLLVRFHHIGYSDTSDASRVRETRSSLSMYGRENLRAPAMSCCSPCSDDPRRENADGACGDLLEVRTESFLQLRADSEQAQECFFAVLRFFLLIFLKGKLAIGFSPPWPRP